MNDGTPPSPMPQSLAARQTSTLAIVALVLGCLSFFCGLFTGIPAMVCGIIALTRIGNRELNLEGKGLAIAGLCLGILSIVLTAVFLGVMALVLPGVNQAQTAAEETILLNEGKQLAAILFTYANDHNGRYPQNLKDLSRQGYVEDDLLYFPGTQHIRWEYLPGLTTSSPPRKSLSPLGSCPRTAGICGSDRRHQCELDSQ